MSKQPTKQNKGNMTGLLLMVLAAIITIVIAFPVTDSIRKMIKDNIKYIRLTNLVGCLLFVWYGILINSIPVVLPNAFLVVVQIVYVMRATRAKP